ncbi:MAG: hypothetical protein JWM99_3987 [Verrucomicrobiales bacterium]|nr:hypothetical protein [Verrucomicrobiales bacterium]
MNTQLKIPTQNHNIQFRPYQLKAFCNRTNGIEIWLWGRQTGKSFTLAAWAVDRLLTRPGRLVTILSNSRTNGMELNAKCAAICERMKKVFEQVDLSPDTTFEQMNMETRINVKGVVGRIKILASNPRTARGFSGDLILDEFAFHENGKAIWEAAEPILTSNSDYLCRIASTPNGKNNMFYHLIHASGLPVRRVTRTEAWRDGCEIFHPMTRQRITPEQARENALDKRAYDQNYECAFAAENTSLLTDSLISQAEAAGVGSICHDNWSPEALAYLNPSRTTGSLYVGVDVGRTHDWTVVTVLEKQGTQLLVRAILRLRNLSLPEQQERLGQICALRPFRRACIDMTGLGLGLYEYSRRQFGSRINGLNFSRTIPLPSTFALEAGNATMVRVPELLALQLLRAYSDREIKHPIDPILREDLRRPERLTSPSGQVSIAADRDSGGHADHFWSLALSVHAARSVPTGGFQVISMPGRLHIPRDYLI